MASLSGCTIVRNCLKLAYPLEASLRTYLPICDEIVIAFDPTSEDKTAEFVLDLTKKHSKIRLLPSPWNLDNHSSGSEICIQSNLAIEACNCDWILYIQADEAIHEGDHNQILKTISRTDANGGLFCRRSFLGTLDREIPAHRSQGLLRLFRNGCGMAVGDAMSCSLLQGTSGEVINSDWRLFNYSRMGDRDEILMRSKNLHTFYHSAQPAIEASMDAELELTAAAFPITEHPLELQRFYTRSTKQTVSQSHASVTLAVLLGKHELENIIPFMWPFRGWPGNVVVLEDETADDSAMLFLNAAVKIFGIPYDRIQIRRQSIGKNFATARNSLHEMASTEWILHADLDERWDPAFMCQIGELIARLETGGVRACGFPRANFLRGALVNDLPDTEWTELGLMQGAQSSRWPPGNHDIQFRLLRSSERWIGHIHEKPECLSLRPQTAVMLSDCWILHSKSLARQRNQDAHYRTLGQSSGLPQSVGIATSLDSNKVNWREKIVAAWGSTVHDAPNL